jgi:hypothetical protein
MKAIKLAWQASCTSGGIGVLLLMSVQVLRHQIARPQACDEKILSVLRDCPVA